MSLFFHTIIAVVVTVFILVALHYLPWQRIFKLPERFPHVTYRYVMGVSAIVGPFSAILIVQNQLFLLISLWVIVVFAGISTVGVYLLDEFIDQRDKAEIGNVMKETRDKLLDEKVGYGREISSRIRSD